MFKVTMPSAMWTSEETMKKSWVHPESQTYEITISSSELMLQTYKLSYKRKNDKKLPTQIILSKVVVFMLDHIRRYPYYKKPLNWLLDILGTRNISST